MEKTDIITCLKKRSKNYKNIKNNTKKNIEKQKSLRIICLKRRIPKRIPRV